MTTSEEDENENHDTSDYHIRSTLSRSFSEHQAEEGAGWEELRALAQMADDAEAIPVEDSQENQIFIESQWRLEHGPLAVPKGESEVASPPVTATPSPPVKTPETTPEIDHKQQFQMLFQMALRKKKSLEPLRLILCIFCIRPTMYFIYGSEPFIFFRLHS